MSEIVVAYGERREIGANNSLLWNHGEMQTDMRRFRRITIGGTVIMGRKTLESMRWMPLEARRNVVVSKSLTDLPRGIEIAESLEEAYDLAGSQEDVYIIGGQQLYQAALDEGSVSRVFATEVKETFPNADTFFPVLDQTRWRETARIPHKADEFNKFNYDLVAYESKSRNLR